MPEKEFLEKYPLYKSMAYDAPKTIDKINRPPISFFCPACKSVQTYIMSNNYWDGHEYSNFDSAGLSLHALYSCVGCGTHTRDFYFNIAMDRKSIEKVGQFPPWEISGDKNIEKMLGNHKQHLSRGLICESQGYGIGAFGYYRRITEEIIDSLISDIESIIPAADKAAFADAYAKVKTTRQTSEKIELIKDLLPSSLEIEGMNPFGILHSALSEGLHANSDQECLSYAEAIRESLVFLSSQISETRNRKTAFTVKMRKLLDKKS